MAIQFEQAKLWLLFLCLAVCIVSLFTSVGVDIAIPTLRYIPGSSRRSYCKGIEETLQRSCSLENTSGKECVELHMKGEKCEKTVQKAYRYINMAGCPFQLQAKALCEREWCKESSEACSKECAQVRKELQECVDTTVNSYLARSL